MITTASLRSQVFGVLGLALLVLVPIGLKLRKSIEDGAELAVRDSTLESMRGIALAAIRAESAGLRDDLRRYRIALGTDSELGSRSLQAELRIDMVALLGDRIDCVTRSAAGKDKMSSRLVEALAGDLERPVNANVIPVVRVGGRLALVVSLGLSKGKELVGLRWLGVDCLEILSVRAGIRFLSDCEGDESSRVCLALPGLHGLLPDALSLRMPADVAGTVQGVREASRLSLIAFACLLFLGLAASFELLIIAGVRRLRKRVESACGEYTPVCDEFVEGDDELAELAHELCRMAGDQRKRLARARSLDDARSAFLANMNYAIRTPMTTILGYGERLRGTEPASPDWDPAARAIEQGCRDLLRTLDDILDLAKYEAGKVMVETIAFDPRLIASELVSELKSMASARGSSLDVSVDQAMPEQVMGDLTLMTRCMVHLLEYAVRATSEGRIVATIRLRVSANSAHRLVIEVCDTGAGMNAPDCDRVFDAFALSDPSGFAKYGEGLALAIAKRTAQVLGGSLDLVTAVGRGTQFTLSLPVQPCERIHAKTRAANLSGQRRLEGVRILVADDARDNRRLIGRMLERAGASVVEACDGREACVLALSSDLVFDLILMDLQMPGLDGIEATRRLRSRDCQIPIIALSADGEVATKQACLKVGCDEFLKKPVPSHDLMRTIAGILSSVEGRSVAENGV